MKQWKTKLLGDNRMNFYGWIVAGLVVMGASFWYVKLAAAAGAGGTSEGLLLIAIYFVLLGQFGVGIHNYLARVAEKLEKEEKDKTNGPAV